MPRLGYKKSRGGCARCKQRRVKCDESKPCSACIRHNTQCSLLKGSADGSGSGSGDTLSWEASSSSKPEVSRVPSFQRRSSSRTGSSGSRKTQTPSTSPIDPSLTPSSLLEANLKLPADFASDRGSSIGNRRSSVAASSPDPFPYFVKFSTEAVEPVHLSKWITDLELMHHYSTATSLTMPRSSDVGSIWQFVVPKLGLTYTFLMHGILAIGALHLGNLHPEQRDSYALHASQHQSDAIAGMRESLINITPDNCHALFAASSLLLLNAYSTFPYQRGAPHSQEAPSVDDILDVFLLVRGMSHILSSFQPAIQAGPLRNFFTEVVAPASTPVLEAVTQHLENLQTTLKTSSADESTKTIVNKEINVFLGWIMHAVETTAFPELRVALTWPINLTEEYLQLLRNRDPAALTLLAYYSVVIRSTESTTWFMQGWGINSARAIASDLDPEWKEMVKWPLAFMSDRSIQL
ncbi:hypothetical protein CORC01_12152 [Colletotrichum orchidophilum]|uniref:Zn(2)-C6 fungal-type domain-containing protein n=1 Tax=Colletotrichum orchidophilum TaxID=1209926 RepID=A0A1G4AU11_9PEZI|nr:uncharacterized protein CORC01_12152 [Colletotrichum orchidophilum]OHE92573.1 hypothetical protein CORC01_12152 [Colletotrichum orchidophilum]